MAVVPQTDLHVLQEENIRLRRAVEELSILNDLARVIGGTMNSQEIMQTIIHRSLRAVLAEQGVITLVDQSSKQTMKTLVRSAVNSSDHLKFHLTESMLGWMHLNKKPLMVNDPPTDERFRGIAWDPAIRNALSVPMTVKSTMIGVLTVYNKKDQKRFTDDDQRLLAILATQSAQVVENARLYEQEKALVHMQEGTAIEKTESCGVRKPSDPLAEYDYSLRYSVLRRNITDRVCILDMLISKNIDKNTVIYRSL